MTEDADTKTEALGKLMDQTGLRRITPEMTTVYGKMEVIALGMGGFFGFLGFFVVLVAVGGLLVASGELLRIFVPKKELTSLEEVLEVRRNAPVDVPIHVDFEKGVKVWKVKGRFFVAPVKGYEGRLFFFRKENYAEGEGTTHPIRVKGWAVGKTLMGWELPAAGTQDLPDRFEAVGKSLPDDAIILYEEDDTSMGSKVWLTLVFLVCGFTVCRLVYRVLETFNMLRSRVVLARKLNELAGLSKVPDGAN